MKYEIEVKPRAIKDLKGISKSDVSKIFEKIKIMEDNLSGDVKRLTNYTPEYRLRVGSWRVLFEVEQDKITIYRIKHRREAYSQRG